MGSMCPPSTSDTVDPGSHAGIAIVDAAEALQLIS